MGKKYPTFDKLPPEIQEGVRAYWRDVKKLSREKQKIRS